MKLISYLTDFSELLPFLFCVAFYKKISTKYLKVFFVYTCGLFIFALVSILLVYIIKDTHSYYINLRLYLLFEYIVFVIFFTFLLNTKTFKKIIFFSIFPFFIYWLYAWINQSPGSFDTHPFILEFLVFMIILLFYLYEKMINVSIVPLYKSISFWLCVGLFIYFTGNFFYFLLISTSKKQDFLKQMRIIYSMVNISKDIILSLAWLAYERQETSADIIQLPDGLGLDDDLPFLTKTNS